MATYTVTIPDELIDLALAAHAEQNARLAHNERTTFIVNDETCTGLVVSQLRGILDGNERGKAAVVATQARQAIQGQVDAILGSPAAPAPVGDPLAPAEPVDGPAVPPIP